MGTVLIATTNEVVEEKLFRAAKQYVSGNDDEILSYWVVDEQEYLDDIQRKAWSGEGGKNVSEALQPTVERHEKITAEIFGDSVTYDTLTEFGTPPDDILEKATEYDCDHLFVTGRKRSPTGKVLFGDTAQQIILNFDGVVTITTIEK